MRRALVDASVLITLTDIGSVDLLAGLDGDVVVLRAIAEEVTVEPATTWLEVAEENGWITRGTVSPGCSKIPEVFQAAIHLGREPRERIAGDIALLAAALQSDDPVVVVTDDKPLRKTCNALSVPVSGSIGVLITAVERGELAPDAAKDALVSMDEVGARLSARLLRKAERLIDEAAEGPGTE